MAFDLYRHEVLKQMHIPVPDNLVQERLLWDLLTKWHYFYEPPWEAANEKFEPDNPFYYDTHSTSTDTAKQQEVILTFKDFSDLIMKKETKNNN